MAANESKLSTASTASMCTVVAEAEAEAEERLPAPAGLEHLAPEGGSELLAPAVELVAVAPPERRGPRIRRPGPNLRRPERDGVQPS